MKPGERSTIDENTGKVHAYKTSFGFCAVLITECDYDRLTGQAVLSKTADAFKSRFTATEIREKDPSSFAWPEIKDLRKEAEAPTGMEAIRKELDETKMVLHQTIASVLERGEKLDTLVAKSEDLTLTSKTFYKGAKQQNGCCAIM